MEGEKEICFSYVFLFIPQATRQTESKSQLEYIKQRHSFIQYTACKTVHLN